MEVFNWGGIVRNLAAKRRASRQGSPRMSEDGEGRREVSVFETGGGHAY